MRVFDSNAAFPDRHLWGVANRAEPTRDEWDASPQSTRTYCEVCGDPDAPELQTRFGIPQWTPWRRSGAICAFRVKPLTATLSHARPANCDNVL